MTYVEISFGLVDVTAKQDTAATATNKQPFVDLADLSREGVFAPKVATLEQAYWKLDGTYDVFPDNAGSVSWGYWSQVMSDAAGSFTMAPVLTLSLSGNHSHVALTFEFDPHGNNYCDHLQVAWYHNADLLVVDDYYPNNWKYVLNQQVENYNKIIITFLHTFRPYRYVKVQNIMHGALQVWGNDSLRSAGILEEVDPTSAELSINTLEFEVVAEDDSFNILNPEGVYSLLQKKQSLVVEGDAGGGVRNFGTFYLDTWENRSDKICVMKAVDGIGVMEGTTFVGDIYFNVPAETIIDAIMDDAGFGYVLDNSLRYISVSGWLPVMSHRAALQQVAIAIGAVVDCSRSGTINIKPQPVLDPVTTITKARKFTGTEVKLRPLVTGVNVVSHNYSLSSTSEQLYSATLPVGVHEIAFDAPVANLSATGASVLASGVNYARVSVTAAGEVIITGKQYADNMVSYIRRMDELPAGEKENLITIKEATLISPAAAPAVAERVYQYYQHRIQQTMRFVLGEEKAGFASSVETSPGVYRDAVIESLDIDLSGGYVTKAVMSDA